MKDDLDIIYNQAYGLRQPDGAPYDDKQGFNLQIAKGAAFVGRLTKAREPETRDTKIIKSSTPS